LYTLAATATLALGIVAATAVFGVIDATVLRALPFSDPDRLVSLRTELASATGTQVLPALPDRGRRAWTSCARCDRNSIDGPNESGMP
jgi:hypothetical protein